MMTANHAYAILAGITVTPERVEKSKKYMLDKIKKSRENKMYYKQGGTMFKFSDDAVAWIKIWGDDYHLTERGETMYLGEDARECAEVLCKMGIAHNLYPNEFLGCV